MSGSRVAVLVSGEGTTAEAFIVAGTTGLISARVDLVISNNPEAGIFERVKKLNKKYGLQIKCQHIDKQNYPPSGEELAPGQQTQAEENALLETLKDGQFDLIALMGYMKKIGPALVREFGWRPQYISIYQAKMVNTHPGLLPVTKGLYGIHVQEFVLQNNPQQAGQSLHVVAKDYDDGPTIAEHKVLVRQNDTPESLFEHVKKTEKKFLPADIDTFIKNRRKYINEQ